MNTNNTAADNTTHECGLSSSAVAWVREHGSEFLRFCVEKGIWCSRLYNQERARLESPGWQLLCDTILPPDNPPAEANDLLARARKWFPQARLRQVYGKGYVEYVAVAESPWPSGGHTLIFDDRIRVYKD